MFVNRWGLGELHLTPLKGIIQLRPSLHHLDHTPIQGAGGTAASDGETTATESEEEEAKPVTVSEFCVWRCLHNFSLQVRMMVASPQVRFSRPNRPGPSTQQGQVPDEPWKMLTYHVMEVCEM